MAEGGTEYSHDEENQFCSDQVLTIVSSSVGKDLNKLSEALGITSAELDEFDEEKFGNKQAAFEILDSWRRSQGINASEDILAEVLVGIKRMDIVRKIFTIPQSSQPQEPQSQSALRSSKLPPSVNISKQQPSSSNVERQCSLRRGKLPPSLNISKQKPSSRTTTLQSSSCNVKRSSKLPPSVDIHKQQPPSCAAKLHPSSNNVERQSSLRSSKLPPPVNMSKQQQSSCTAKLHPYSSNVERPSSLKGSEQPPSVNISKQKPSSRTAKLQPSSSNVVRHLPVNTLMSFSTVNKKQPSSTNAGKELHLKNARPQPSVNSATQSFSSNVPQQQFSKRLQTQPHSRIKYRSNAEQQSHPSIPKDQKYLKLPPGLIEDDVLMVVAERLGKDWVSFACKLGLTQPMIERIQLDYAQYGVKEMTYRTMAVWRNSEAEAATKEKLSEHLIAIGRKDIECEISSLGLSKQHAMANEANQQLSRDETDNLKQLQDRLRSTYKGLQMKGLPWMDNVVLSLENHFTELELIEEGGREQEKRKLELNELFMTSLADQSGKKPSMILIEGDAGYGKTTIGAKLCFDFSIQTMYINKFDVVLFYSLRNFDGSLENMFYDAANCVTQKQRDDLRKLLSNKSVNTLIILDGFDEIGRDSAESVLSLIRREVFPLLNVVVTSRPGRFSPSAIKILRQSHSNFSSDVGIDLMQIWDKRLKVYGVGEERQHEFLQKHLSNFSVKEKQYVQHQLELLKRENVLAVDLLKCPLFFLMIVLLLTEKEELDLNLNTRTDLYKRVMNFVLRRYLTKMAEPSASTADLFVFDNTCRPFYIDMMSQFGKFSIDALNTDKLSFHRVDVLGESANNDSRILDLGILNKTVLARGPWETECYEPIHKSLMEFGAAYFLWTEFIAERNERWKKIIRKFRPTRDNYSSSLLFPFLAGLMGNQSSALYSTLSPYAHEYSAQFHTLRPTLSEITVTDSVLNSLNLFFPPIWNVSAWSSLPSELMVQGLKSLKIKKLELNLEYPLMLVDNIKVEKLELIVEDKLATTNQFQFKRIECNDLSLVLKTVNMCEEFWKDLLSLILTIQFKCISFTMHYYCTYITRCFLPFIYDAAINGKLGEANIYCIAIDVNEKKQLDLLIGLIQKERISALCISRYELEVQDDFDSLLKHISKSLNLTRFEFNCYPCHLTLNLAYLWDAGEKSYEYLRFLQCEMEFRNCMQTYNFECKLLELDDVCNTESVSNWLHSCRVSSIYGNYPTLDSESHLLYESLTEMTIELNDRFFSQEQYTRLINHRSLRMLTLKMTVFECKYLSVDDWLLEFLPHLPLLQGIKIEDAEENLSFVKTIVECVAKYFMKRLEFSLKAKSNTSFSVAAPSESDNSPLQHFSINYDKYHYLEVPEFSSILLLLKHLLIRKALRQLELTNKYGVVKYFSYFTPDGCSSLVDMFPPEDHLVVEHDVLVWKVDDPILNRQNTSRYETFSICLNDWLLEW